MAASTPMRHRRFWVACADWCEAVGVLVVQHVRSEGAYAIGEALVAAGLRLRVCRVWAGDPRPESLAGLIDRERGFGGFHEELLDLG